MDFEKSPLVIETMLKEYEMLRQEIVASMQTRGSILTFSFTIIGAMFAASVAADSSQQILVSLILSFGVPSIAVFSLFQWLGEYQRMHRAGGFIKELEDRINVLLKTNAMSWENHLRKGKLHMAYPYNSTIFAMLSISFVGTILGIFSSSLASKNQWGWFLLSLIAHFAIFYIFSYKIEEIKKKWNSCNT